MASKISYSEIIDRLHALGDPSVVIQKEEKFGVRAQGALGVYLKDLNQLAKEIGKNDALGIQLYESGIYEGKLLCSKVFRPKSLTEKLMESWVKDFDNWEICDSFSMKLFPSGPFGMKKILEWTQRAATFEKRAGFVLLTCYGSVYKETPNEVIEAFFPIIQREAWDDRIYVRKALSWALRNIGKRNPDLRQAAIREANLLLTRAEKAAQWIAKDVLRELQKEDLSIRNYPKSIYR